LDITSSHAVEKLVQFLEESEEEIIAAWLKSICMDETTPRGRQVKEKGMMIYRLLKRSILDPLIEKDVKKLAYQIAEERLKANINIGDFVYNIIHSRSVIFHFIHQSKISFDEAYKALDTISTTLDHFCYYAVTRYTELSNQELQEKVIYINQTHKDRLTLLGQMSSSFVHEFRNPLTSIMGFIKLLKSEQINQMYLEIIEHELEQLNYRITQFLHTSKKEVADKDKEIVLLPAMMTDILDFIYPLVVDVDCELVSNIESNLKIFAYCNELKQVLQNIFLNSLDALKEKDKPRKIKVTCRMEDGQVLIQIANNGPKIPSDKMGTIFEPFFTTKELGTGIGLYVCKKIVEKHGGKIDCESNDDWTTFTIYLPFDLRE